MPLGCKGVPYIKTPMEVAGEAARGISNSQGKPARCRCNPFEKIPEELDLGRVLRTIAGGPWPVLLRNHETFVFVHIGNNYDDVASH